MLMFFAVLLSLNFILKVENRRCSGVNGDECCTGYILNATTGECEKCPRGFYDDCLKQCTPPHYGEDCQSECNCADGYYCHFADGCSKSIIGDDAANKESSSTSFISQEHSSRFFLYSVSEKPATISAQTIKVRETSVKNDVDVLKNNYIFTVIIVLIGVFVLFFSIFVIAYIYKCFRKNAIDSGIKNAEGQAQYKSLDFEAVQLEPAGQQINLEQRGRFISDSSYLSPIFVRSESLREQDDFPINENRRADPEILPESVLNKQDKLNPETKAILPHGDFTEHVYIEVTEDDCVLKAANLTGNGEDIYIRRDNTLRRESAYVNENI